MTVPDAPRNAWWRHAVPCTRSTCGRSPTATATAPATSPGCVHVSAVEELGVDAVWINPWYRSPLHDGGYDVCGLWPDQRLLRHHRRRRGFHRRSSGARDPGPRRSGPRPHPSSEHAWFVEALAPPIGRRLGLAALGSGVGDRWPTARAGDARVVVRGDLAAGTSPLDELRVVEGVPRWRWQVGDVVLEAEVAMSHGRPAVGIVHRLLHAHIRFAWNCSRWQPGAMLMANARRSASRRSR